MSCMACLFPYETCRVHLSYPSIYMACETTFGRTRVLHLGYGDEDMSLPLVYGII
jgi:hypothetical protein